MPVSIFYTAHTLKDYFISLQKNSNQPPIVIFLSLFFVLKAKRSDFYPSKDFFAAIWTSISCMRPSTLRLKSVSAIVATLSR